MSWAHVYVIIEERVTPPPPPRGENVGSYVKLVDYYG